MPDRLEARPVEPGPDCVGQVEQALELHRHEVDVGDGPLVEEAHGLGGVELVAHDHGRARDGGKEAERPLRRVVHGPLQERAARGRHELPQHAGDQREEVAGNVGATGECAADALGATRRARRVEHRPTEEVDAGFIRGRRRQRALVARQAPVVLRPRDQREPDRGGPIVGQRGLGDVREELVHHQHLAGGVVEHIRQLVGGPVPVHGHVRRPQVRRGPERLEGLTAVADHQGEGVARCQAGAGEHVHEPDDALGQLGPGRLPPLVGEGEVAPSFGDEPVQQLRHGPPSVSATALVASDAR